MKPLNLNRRTVSRGACQKKQEVRIIVTLNCSKRTIDNVENDIYEVLMNRKESDFKSTMQRKVVEKEDIENDKSKNN